jgi:hypothetical protein
VQAKFIFNAMPCATFTVLRYESKVVSKVGFVKMIQPEQFNLFVIDQLTDKNVGGTLMLILILCNRTLQASCVVWYVKVTCLQVYYILHIY